MTGGNFPEPAQVAQGRVTIRRPGLVPALIQISPWLKLDTTKPETIDLQGESRKISATWHHAVVGRGDAVA